MRWIERLDQAPAWLDEPVAWVAPHDLAGAWPLPPATAEDRADAARARREGGAPRLLRRRMLRALIARTLSLHPDTVRFGRDPAGAPQLEGLAAHISASGCKGWSAVALALTPVGVDLEPVGGGPVSAELERWVALEAHLKARGVGLVGRPDAADSEPLAGRWTSRVFTTGAERVIAAVATA